MSPVELPFQSGAPLGLFCRPGSDRRSPLLRTGAVGSAAQIGSGLLPLQPVLQVGRRAEIQQTEAQILQLLQRQWLDAGRGDRIGGTQGW